MTAQELINELEKLKDKDVDLYVNVHGREFWISEIAYSDCNEVCFGIQTDFPDDGSWFSMTGQRLKASYPERIKAFELRQNDE